MGNGYRGCGPHGAIGYRGYGAIGYRGMGYRTYGPHGQWVQEYGAYWVMCTPWPHLGPIQVMCQNVKKMSSCQKDVKLSKRYQMSKIQTPRLWRRFTKELNWHNEVHRYWCQFWCHKWWSLKTLKMFIESIFGQFWWPSYLTSKLMSIFVNLIMSIYFFVNLLHSPDVWLFDIWHLFDNLTFWHIT